MMEFMFFVGLAMIGMGIFLVYRDLLAGKEGG